MFDGPPPETDSQERLARLRLARSPRIGAVTFHEALGHFGSARAACAELPTISAAQAEREHDRLVRLGGQLIVWGDALYPAALASLPDAPPVLSAIGDPALLGRRTLAIVGAREASLAGRRFAAELAAALGAAGFAIASGLARGIDAAAHEAALDQERSPSWPAASTRSIRRRMPDCTSRSRPRGCCWPSRRSARHRSPAFPRRNRIVSGLSAGVVVIEAAARSGSLITAHRAAEQGREVFVMPGSPADPRHAGSNSLIRDGAILTRDANDILSVLGLPHFAAQVVEKPQQKYHDRDTAKVVEALGASPTAVDELVRRCQVSAATVAEILLSLELEGRLERHRGNRVSLI